MDQLYHNLQLWLGLTATLIIQYFSFTVVAFMIFFVWKRKDLWFAHIQQKYPENKHIKREILYSFLSIIMLGGFLTLTVWLDKNNYTMAYKPIDKYGWGYYFLSVFIMIALHDTYYYWVHRLLHWGPMFKYVHKVHHMSTNPTPFSAYCFHPLEGLFQLSIVFVIDFTIPHHQSAILLFGCYSLVVNMWGHVGYEFFPRWFARHKIFKWQNTATHHNLHHTNVKKNFSIYFNFWDRVMKTNSHGYEEHFEKVVDRRDELKAQKKAEATPTADKKVGQDEVVSA